MSTCKRTLLAKSDQFRIDLCSCGFINLQFGQTSIRVSPQEMINLSNILHNACDNYMSYAALLQARFMVGIQADSSLDHTLSEEDMTTSETDKTYH